RDRVLARDPHALPVAVEDHAVIAALDAVLQHRAHRERRGAMAAAVFEHSGLAVGPAEHDHLLVHDRARERLLAELAVPRGLIPSVARPGLCSLVPHGLLPIAIEYTVLTHFRMPPVH